MSEKLKNYQVLDVLCGGTFYKVRHKVTNNIFAWKAYDCSSYSDAQVQDVVNDVKTIRKVTSGTLINYYDTILHAPTKTLYFVLEYNSWRSVQELTEVCKATDKVFAENFIWYLVVDLARVCNAIEELQLSVVQKHIDLKSIFVNDSAELRINCFDLPKNNSLDLMLQIGHILNILCNQHGDINRKSIECYYSDDLADLVAFLVDDKNVNLQASVLLYHPTVLANVEAHQRPNNLSEILVSREYTHSDSEINKCDSQKVVELSRIVEPAPRKCNNLLESPIYYNINLKSDKVEKDINITQNSLSPTISALALELPGYVPRSRKAYSETVDEIISPHKVSEHALSQQWMSRLIALRRREQSLNKRERNLIGKEIINSPSTKIVPFNAGNAKICQDQNNGITLPPMINQAEDRSEWVSRRHQRASNSVRVRPRRKSYAYEDLDSSLSADPGDDSFVVTSTKFTKENMPRRTIFPDVGSKKVHFTSANPFTDSDESVTLTFYELDNIDNNGHQVPHQADVAPKDISKFKYLDVDKIVSEKRAAKNWTHSSPSKQAKVTKKLSDITNSSDCGISKTPSKSSLLSKSSNSSVSSSTSVKSQWSGDTNVGKVSDIVSQGNTRSNMRQSLAQTPIVPHELKKSKRKSLLPFKTPFKFKTSTKV